MLKYTNIFSFLLFQKIIEKNKKKKKKELKNIFNNSKKGRA